MNKNILLTTTLIFLSFNVLANDFDETTEEDIIQKVEGGSFFKIVDLKSNILNQSYTKNNSFYFNIISKSILPNLKLEYNNDNYKNKRMQDNLSQDSYNNEVDYMDMNLQYGDVVSYYTASNSHNFNLNFGVGFRQYLGSVEYNENKIEVEQSITSTIPLSYLDFYYYLDSKENISIGSYIKSSEFNNNTVNDTGIYFKTYIEKIDNLSFIASYSTSNMSFLGDSKNDSSIESSGLNFELKYYY